MASGSNAPSTTISPLTTPLAGKYQVFWRLLWHEVTRIVRTDSQETSLEHCERTGAKAQSDASLRGRTVTALRQVTAAAYRVPCLRLRTSTDLTTQYCTL
jgi:hypothetical protein